MRGQKSNMNKNSPNSNRKTAIYREISLVKRNDHKKKYRSFSLQKSLHKTSFYMSTEYEKSQFDSSYIHFPQDLLFPL